MHCGEGRFWLFRECQGSEKGGIVANARGRQRYYSIAAVGRVGQGSRIG